MKIPSRRKDFLRIIKEMYEASGLPVHYIKVAQAMGVSKWTAYDILKQLEKDGYLASEYSLNREEGRGGRSILLFYPTPKADRAFLKPKAEPHHHHDWQAAKNRLLSLLEAAKMGEVEKIEAEKIIDDLLREVPSIEAHIIAGAYLIAILIFRLLSLGTKVLASMHRLIQNTPKPELVLSIFAGTALGATVKNVQDSHISGKLTEEVGRLQKFISEFSARENGLLASFLREALERAIYVT